MVYTSSKKVKYRIYFDTVKRIYFLTRSKKHGSRYKEFSGAPSGYVIKEAKNGFVYLKKV